MSDLDESAALRVPAPLGALEFTELARPESLSGRPALASFTLSGDLAISAAQALARAAIHAKGSAEAQANADEALMAILVGFDVHAGRYRSTP